MPHPVGGALGVALCTAMKRGYKYGTKPRSASLLSAITVSYPRYPTAALQSIHCSVKLIVVVL